MPRLAAIFSAGRTVRGWQIQRVANELEEGNVLRLDFHKLDDVAGVIPCAVQDVDTGEVILVAYVNEQALLRTAERRLATF